MMDSELLSMQTQLARQNFMVVSTMLSIGVAVALAAVAIIISRPVTVLPCGVQQEVHGPSAVTAARASYRLD